MDIAQFATQSRLPLKILKWMETEKFIHNPLTEEDLIGLRLLEKVWCSREVLRCQLSTFSKERRLNLISSADIKTKWERYAYSRYRNLKGDEKLSMKMLIEEIQLTFNFQLNHSHIRKLYRVRKRVYNERTKQKNCPKTLLNSGKQIKETKFL